MIYGINCNRNKRVVNFSLSPVKEFCGVLQSIHFGAWGQDYSVNLIFYISCVSNLKESLKASFTDIFLFSFLM